MDFNEEYRKFLAAWNASDTIADEGFTDPQSIGFEDYEEIISQCYAIENTGAAPLLIRFGKRGGRDFKLMPGTVIRKFVNRFWAKADAGFAGELRTFTTMCPPEPASKDSCCQSFCGLNSEVATQADHTAGSQQMPDLVVPEGVVVALKASPANADVIYVSGSDACAGLKGFPLKPGEPLNVRVCNLNTIWFTSLTNDGEKLHALFETNNPQVCGT